MAAHIPPPEMKRAGVEGFRELLSRAERKANQFLTCLEKRDGMSFGYYGEIKQNKWKE